MSFQDPMLCKAAVANRLGCCERSLERKVRDGQFPPALRFGKESLWFESVLDAWLEVKRDEQQAWKPRKNRLAKVLKGLATAAASATAIDPRMSQVFTNENLSKIGRPVSLDDYPMPAPTVNTLDSCSEIASAGD